MSTNHNRIRVADLETSDCDKILKTNAKGELEFIDAGKLQVDSYNALDCTTEGKILDARQGKVLKDMIDNIEVPSLVNDITSGGTNLSLTAEMGRKLNEIKSNLNNPNFSGIPTAPTASKDTVTTQIATTEFVRNALNNSSGVISLTGTGVNNIDPKNPMVQIVTATQAGVVNNSSLQELGGADKLINGIRIGKGGGNTDNIVLGINALNSNTNGFGNLAIGKYSLYSNTSGTGNTSIGYSLVSNTTGSNNVAMCDNALLKNTTGYQNIAIGLSALGENNGNENVSIGLSAGYIDGNSNFVTNVNKSVFIGNSSKPNSNGEANQIVIGNDATGGGSNTVTIGGNQTIRTFLKGTLNTVGLSVFSDNVSAKAGGKIVGDMYRKSTGELMIVF